MIADAHLLRNFSILSLLLKLRIYGLLLLLHKFRLEDQWILHQYFGLSHQGWNIPSQSRTLRQL